MWKTIPGGLLTTKNGKKEERVGTRRSILFSINFMCFLAIKVDSPVLFTYN